MKNFGLTGYPLGHSLSPVIHKELFKIMNIEASYNLFETAPENLKDEIPELKKLNGFNVTIPHKIKIIPFLDDLDERAKLFGAVNTVKTGKISVGYNTDCFGFLRALDSADIKLEGKVLLCGAGGAARMCAFEAALANCDLTVAVRDSDLPYAEKIKQEIKAKLNKEISVMRLGDISPDFPYNLIINCTPVGMFPKTNACILSKEIIANSKAVFDLVYNPAETLFVKYAKEAGIKYSNGLSMLVWQAAVAQEIWNGFKFTPDDIKKVLDITKRELD
ncbi:MAG: shikimate dehydrogenase [Clostridiales bacterium]|nr:shikimate dehydrogenase [Clostridiales bacterium]